MWCFGGKLLKFLFYPFKWLLISIFIGGLFYVTFPLISSKQVGSNERVFYAATIGIVLFLTKTFECLKLIISYKKENIHINLKALSYREFVNELTTYNLNKNAN